MAESLRVLFVEDSEDDLALLLRELRKGGYDPAHVRVETELALRAALDIQTWDLILSDFSMPMFDGIAAFEIARSLRPEVPFIFVSGRIGEERAVDAMRRGVKDYVLKDNLRRLIPAIRRELQEAQARNVSTRALQALAMTEEKYKLLVEGSIQGISMVQNGRIVYSNPAHARMLGYGDPAHLVGVEGVALMPAEDREAATRDGRPPARGGTAINPYYRGLRKDGSVFWYEATAAITRWQGKNAQQW
ncbi:MAG TPA: response regulator, partial [bacterium]